MTYLTNYAIIT